MVTRRSLVRSALVLAAVMTSLALGSATAVAAELDDYLWKSRPLLLFAPTDSDPRLVETVNRIEASRCDFVDRDMVLGSVVTDGDSTLDGQAVSAAESSRLIERYAIDGSGFTVLLIGKDGGEKLRVENEVPALLEIYAVIDGMPMRSREASADPSRC